jgi:hypothetical protein
VELTITGSFRGAFFLARDGIAVISTQQQRGTESAYDRQMDINTALRSSALEKLNGAMGLKLRNCLGNEFKL